MYQFKAKLLTLLMVAGCAATEEPPQEVVRSEQLDLGRVAVGRWRAALGHLGRVVVRTRSTRRQAHIGVFGRPGMRGPVSRADAGATPTSRREIRQCAGRSIQAAGHCSALRQRRLAGPSDGPAGRASFRAGRGYSASQCRAVSAPIAHGLRGKARGTRRQGAAHSRPSRG